MPATVNAAMTEAVEAMKELEDALDLAEAESRPDGLLGRVEGATELRVKAAWQRMSTALTLATAEVHARSMGFFGWQNWSEQSKRDVAQLLLEGTAWEVWRRLREGSPAAKGRGALGAMVRGRHRADCAATTCGGCLAMDDKQKADLAAKIAQLRGVR